MQLNLTEPEAQLLGEVLATYLKDLRGEIIDTDNAEFRRTLRAERDSLVSIAARLTAEPAHTQAAITKMVRVTAVLTEYD